MATYHPIRLRDVPVKERPASRVMQVGADSVSLTELLATVIGGEHQIEAAQTLLALYGSLNALAQAPIQELVRVEGVGQSRAAALKAALALGARLVAETDDEHPRINAPGDVARLLFRQAFSQESENFWVIPLNIRNRVQEVVHLYKGQLAGVRVRIAEVFREAIRRNCAAIIVAHNHPSGDPTPSPEDVLLTKDLASAGKQLDIEVLDHIVLGAGGNFVSLAALGKLG